MGHALWCNPPPPTLCKILRTLLGCALSRWRQFDRRVRCSTTPGKSIVHQLLNQQNLKSRLLDVGFEIVSSFCFVFSSHGMTVASLIISQFLPRDLPFEYLRSVGTVRSARGIDPEFCLKCNGGICTYMSVRKTCKEQRTFCIHPENGYSVNYTGMATKMLCSTSRTISWIRRLRARSEQTVNLFPESSPSRPLGSMSVSFQMRTYPSPNPTLTKRG